MVMDHREWGPIAFKGADHAVVNEAMACTFDEWMESTENILDVTQGADQQPHPLKIQYLGPDGGRVDELVFEDPEDRDSKDVGARLLVSKDAVLDLKKLCEREFGRVETLSRMLNACRCAYYKELLYLREQLIQAAQPQNAMQWDWVRSYEVYWFDPPKYCDGELCDFLKDCIRLTHKKLIEENYELMLKLQGKDVADLNADPDMQIKRMMKQMGGPGRLVKRMHFILNSRDGAEPGQLEDFMKAIADLAPADDPDTPTDNKGPDELRKQLHELRGKLGQLDMLRRQIKEANEEVEKAKAMVEQNAKRAAAEAERAEAERARAEALEQELAAMKTQASKPDSALQIAEQRILSVISTMDKQAGAWINSQVQSVPGGKVGNMDATVAGLEKAVKGLLSSVPKPKAAPAPKGTVVQTKEVIVKESDPADQERIKLLEGQLKKAQQDRDAARAQINQLEQQLQQTEGKLAEEQSRPAPVIVKKPDTPPPPPKEKEKEPEPVRIIQKGTDPAIVKELEFLRKQRQEWDAERETFEGKLSKMEDRLKKQAEKFEADLKAERDAAHEREAKVREKLKHLEEELEEMGMKLTKAQEKLAVTKEELNRYKRAAGERVVDSDDDDSDDNEDGVPRFLIRYFRRVKNNPKPRWMHLSEDAGLAEKKRRWLMAKKFPASDVKQAFNFLKSSAQEINVLPPGGGKQKRPGALDPYLGALGDDGGHFPPMRPGSQGGGMWVWVPTGGPGSSPSGPGSPGSPTSRSPSPTSGGLKARRNSSDPRPIAQNAAAATTNFTTLASMPMDRPAGSHPPQTRLPEASAVRKRSPSPPKYLQPPQPHIYNETFALGAMSITSAAASAHSAAALAIAASQQRGLQQQSQVAAALPPQRSRSPPRALVPRQQQSGAVGPNDTLIAHVAALSGFALQPNGKFPAPAPVRHPDAERVGRAPVAQMREDGSSRHASPGASPSAARRIQIAVDAGFTLQGPRSPSPPSPGHVAKGFAGVLPMKGGLDPEPAKPGALMSTATIGDDLDVSRGRSGSPSGIMPMRPSPLRSASSPHASPERPSSRSRERQSESAARDGSSKGKKPPSTIGELVQSELSPEVAALAESSARGRSLAAADDPVRPRRLHSEFAKTLETPLNSSMSKFPAKAGAMGSMSGSFSTTGEMSMSSTAKALPLVSDKPVSSEKSPPPPAPAVARDTAMIAARSMAKRSGSTGTLPLTNMGMVKIGVGGAGASPLKPRRTIGMVGTMGRSTESGPFGSASYSTLSSEGFLPEVLPPLPHHKIKKAPPQPSWMKPSS